MLFAKKHTRKGTLLGKVHCQERNNVQKGTLSGKELY
jgi:hypothetical protein